MRSTASFVCTHRPARTALLFWGLLPLACGARSSDGGRSEPAADGPAAAGSVASERKLDTDELGSVPAYLEAFAEQGCKTSARCQDSELTQEQCVATRLAALQSITALQLPTVHLNPAQAQTCLSRVEGVSCDPDATALDESLAACGEVFSGEVSAGAACSYDEECELGMLCDKSTTCPGTCKRLSQAGEACNPGCSTGLVCFDGTCQAPLDEGEPCGADTPACAGTSVCKLDQEPATCQPPGHVGVGEDCRYSYCAPGSHCKRDFSGDGSIKCEADVALGKTCIDFDSCVDGAHCEAPLLEEGLCVANVALGDPCTGISLFECKEGQCLDGRCAYPVGLGEPCTEDADCYSNHCDKDKCALAPACSE